MIQGLSSKSVSTNSHYDFSRPLAKPRQVEGKSAPNILQSNPLQFQPPEDFKSAINEGAKFSRNTNYSWKQGLQALNREFEKNAFSNFLSSTLGVNGNTNSFFELSPEIAKIFNSIKSGSASTSNASSTTSAIGAAYSALELFTNLGNISPEQGAIRGATTGAYLGTNVFPGIGTLAGGLLGGAIGFVAGLFKNSGKHKDQIARDKVREGLREFGLIDQFNKLNFSSGVSFDVGLDGKAQLVNLDGTKRRVYNVDFNNPLAAQAIGWVQPLVTVLLGGTGKQKDDFTGYFVNAVLSNASDMLTLKQNVLELYGKTGFSGEQIFAALDSLRKEGKIAPDNFLAYQYGLVDAFRSEYLAA